MLIMLEALGGFFWATAYILIIMKGFKDKTYGMPLVAFCFNFSWEFTFSVFYPPGLDLGLTKFLWLFLDCIILYQILKYWKKEIKKIRTIIFYLIFSFMFLLSFALVVLTRKEFGVTFGDFYAPYFINLLMSILFILMLYNRSSLRGQSIFIALFKLLGTATYSIWCFIFIEELNHSRLILFLYFVIFIFDLTYLLMLYLEKKKKLFVFSNKKVLPA